MEIIVKTKDGYAIPITLKNTTWDDLLDQMHDQEIMWFEGLLIAVENISFILRNDCEDNSNECCEEDESTSIKPMSDKDFKKFKAILKAAVDEIF